MTSNPTTTQPNQPPNRPTTSASPILYPPGTLVTIRVGPKPINLTWFNVHGEITHVEPPKRPLPPRGFGVIPPGYIKEGVYVLDLMGPWYFDQEGLRTFINYLTEIADGWGTWEEGTNEPT